MDASLEPEEFSILLKRLRQKRRKIATFSNRMEPRGACLTNIGIVSSAIATLLTAGPAIGGLKLTEALGSAGSNSPSWRILCVAATCFSLIAAVATNLFRSYDIATRLSKAQACDAKLEALEMLIELKQLSMLDATRRFEDCLPEVSFMRDDDAEPPPTDPLDAVEASIFSPDNARPTGTSFTCSGIASGLTRGVHLWLAVEIDGRIWPKEGEVHVKDDGSWNKFVSEEGESDQFSLSLWVANTRGDKFIRAWLNQSHKLAQYVELRRTDDMRRLAKIDGLYRTSAVHR